MGAHQLPNSLPITSEASPSRTPNVETVRHLSTRLVNDNIPPTNRNHPRSMEALQKREGTLLDEKRAW